jgi:hypothetical protein
VVVSPPDNYRFTFSVSSSIDVEAFTSQVSDVTIIFIFELFEPITALSIKFEISISTISVDCDSLIFVVCNNVSCLGIKFEQLVSTSISACNHKFTISESENSLRSHSIDNDECFTIIKSIVNLGIWINILDVPLLIVVVVSSPDNYSFSFSVSSAIDIKEFCSSDIGNMAIIFIFELLEPVISLSFHFQLSIFATSIDSNCLVLII